MTATETKPKFTADSAYALLMKGIEAGGPMAMTKVQAMVKQRHAVSLEDYHKCPGSDEDKVEYYRELVRAILPKRDAAPEPRAVTLTAESPIPSPARFLPTSVDKLPELFRELVTLIKQADGKYTPPVHIQIAAHLRAATGKTMNLGVYNISTEVTAEDKAQLYTECIEALKAGDLSTLKGEVGRGDKRAEPEAKAGAEVPTPAAPEAVAEEPEPAPSAEADPDDTDAAVQAALRALELAKQAAARKKAEAAKAQAAVDEVAVRRIIAESLPKVPTAADIEAIVTHALGNGGFPTSRVESIIESRLKAALPSFDVDKVVAPKVDELLSLKLSDFLKRPVTIAPAAKPVDEGKLASYIPELDGSYVVSAEQRDFLKHVANLSHGGCVNVIATGPAGCGKTTLAEVMGAEFKKPVLIMDCANIREPLSTKLRGRLGEWSFAGNARSIGGNPVTDRLAQIANRVARPANVVKNNDDGEERVLKIGWSDGTKVNRPDDDTVWLSPDAAMKARAGTMGEDEIVDALTGQVLLGGTMKRTMDKWAFNAALREAASDPESKPAVAIWQAFESAIARNDVLKNWPGCADYFKRHAAKTCASKAEVQKALDTYKPCLQLAAAALAWNIQFPANMARPSRAMLRASLAACARARAKSPCP